VVPRHKHSAVDRNRLKRRLCELVRVDLLPVLRAGVVMDVAIRARADAYATDVDALRTDVLFIQSRVTRMPRRRNSVCELFSCWWFAGIR
jgi:RNase P protein component